MRVRLFIAVSAAAALCCGAGVAATPQALWSGLFAGQSSANDLQLTDALAYDDNPAPDLTLNPDAHFSLSDTKSGDGGELLSSLVTSAPDAALAPSHSGDMSFSLATGLHVNFGGSVLDSHTVDLSASRYLEPFQPSSVQFDQPLAEMAYGGMDWDFASWGGVGLVAGHATEHNGFATGFDTAAGSASTSSVGLAAHVDFGKGWVTSFSYNQGVTQLDLRPNAVVSSTDSLDSRTYGFAIAKNNVFGNDSMNFAVTRPLQVFAGGVDWATVNGVDANGNLLIGNQHLPFSGATPETDFEVGYVTTFLDGALALQANAGYQMNLQGQNGSNAISVISRAKINF
jgi:hypothetical protein